MDCVNCRTFSALWLTHGAYPVYLLSGFSKTFIATTYWLKCVVAGSIDVHVSGTKTFACTVYRQDSTSSSKTSIASYSGSLIVNDTIPLYGPFTVYIKLTASSSSTFTCKVSQHVDEASLPYGGHWKPSSDPGSNTTLRTPYFVFFFPANRISYFITAIEQDGYLNWIEAVARGTMMVAEAVELLAGVASAASTGGLSAVALLAVRAQYKFIVDLFIDAVVVPELKNFAIQDMASAAEVSDWNNPDSTAKHGLRLLITIDEVDAQAYFVEVWNAPEAVGPSGSIGTFARYTETDYAEMNE